MTTVYTPPIVWSQRTDTVYANIDLQDVSNAKISLEKDIIKFSGIAQEKNYEVELPLNQEIDLEKSKYIVQPRHIVFLLFKKEPEWWDRLGKDKLRFVKVDWATWKDEDELEEEDEAPGGMPGGMPGMPGGMPGGFPGMDFGDMNFGDFGGADSGLPDLEDDDDDIPDLEEESSVPEAKEGEEKEATEEKTEEKVEEKVEEKADE